MRLAVADQVTPGRTRRRRGPVLENETNYEVAEHRHVMAQRLENYVPYGDRMVAHVRPADYKPTTIGPIGWHRRCSP